MVLLAADRGLYGHARGAHHAASKGGAIALMRSLALELAPHGVTVNAINPGTTDTPLARATLSDEEWQRRAAQDRWVASARPRRSPSWSASWPAPAGAS